MKKILKDYFSFSKKERIAIFILLFLVGVFMALPYFFSVKDAIPVVDPALKAFVGQKKAGEATIAADSDMAVIGHTPGNAIPEKGGVLFSFDPNTLPVEGWIKLGVKAGTANTISRYRSKGGRFRKPEDIRKIWGMPQQQADRLLPYVVIQTDQQSSDHHVRTPGNEKLAAKNMKPASIEINTASVDEWKALPGIGEVFANRIVRYRERVNGFDSIGQIKKVYGLADSIFQQILPYLHSDPGLLKKLNLNTVSAWVLSRRTGIPENMARAIVVYRQQYGAFASVNDLKKIVFINDSLLARIIPFVVVE